MLLLDNQRSPGILQSVRRKQMTTQAQHALSRQRGETDVMKRDQWTEDDLLGLPAEEPDRFDRKSGRLFENTEQFLTAVGKALSAFANSGGGALLLGVEDNGSLDGLPSMVGRASMRDWVEQKIPPLLDYPLSDFRVHTVVRAQNSVIPNGREVIVIEVGDSALAPHQSKRDYTYYQRVGGRSVPAGHFYLELLRQRLTNPVLTFEFEGVHRQDFKFCDRGPFFYPQLRFRIKNVGRVAAYKWSLEIRQIRNAPNGCENRYFFSNFPTVISRDSFMRVDPTILPGCEVLEFQNFGFLMPIGSGTRTEFDDQLQVMFGKTEFAYQLATESSPGDLTGVSFYDAMKAAELYRLAPDRFTP